MKKEIIIGIISSALGALILFFAVTSLGLLEKQISDSQIQDLSNTIVNTSKYRNVIINKMKGQFLNYDECNWSAWKDRVDTEPSEVQCEKGKFLVGIRFKHVMNAKWYKEEFSVHCCPVN